MSESSEAKHAATDEQPAVAIDEQPPAEGIEEDGIGVAAVPATLAGLPATAQGHFAVVNANGTLARGFGAVSSTRLAVGQYQVVFIQNVASSAFTATIGLTGSVGASPPGEIAVVGRAGIPAGVFVQTWNSSGVPADRAFHLHVSS
ncbi:MULTISPECIES: hypothetical protein [unclassified Plantactinospora]|uniref:hypothetical protein n=1 Tax=unclassified Plantactinospora TaxID=2631981 RepID=UPI000D16BC6B|nr:MULTISPECIES: hypothetical protein [unclassified Plantactinospora]AVT30291.1 hypothetical protein C6361_13190 [Plantactinospora sp. BC1]AVT37098.1 hypothetical protein C6W10_12215 [Plantactinospora sp. BB1]